MLRDVCTVLVCAWRCAVLLSICQQQTLGLTACCCCYSCLLFKLVNFHINSVTLSSKTWGIYRRIIIVTDINCNYSIELGLQSRTDFCPLENYWSVSEFVMDSLTSGITQGCGQINAYWVQSCWDQFDQLRRCCKSLHLASFDSTGHLPRVKGIQELYAKQLCLPLRHLVNQTRFYSNVIFFVVPTA